MTVHRARHPATIQRAAPTHAALVSLSRRSIGVVGGPPPHPARQWTAASVQRAEPGRWYCKLCDEEATSPNRFKRPDKGECRVAKKKGHEWKSGSKAAYEESTLKKLEERTTLKREDLEEKDPSRFQEAKDWDTLSGMIAKWAVLRSGSEQTPEREVFSNVGTADGAVTAVTTVENQQGWRRAFASAVSSANRSGNSLTHTGVLKATICATGGATVYTFYAAVANVFVNSKGELALLRDGEDGDNKGSCHTEQISLYHLHRCLARLVSQGVAFASVKLQWYTEKPMCTQWCVPALVLFIGHWAKQQVAVDSADF